MTHARPKWLVGCYIAAIAFGCATIVLGSIALIEVVEAWHTSANVHAGRIHTFQVFGVAAIITFKVAFLLFLSVNAKSNMDRTYP